MYSAESYFFIALDKIRGLTSNFQQSGKRRGFPYGLMATRLSER
jgi:hypothetical protein